MKLVPIALPLLKGNKDAGTKGLLDSRTIQAGGFRLASVVAGIYLLRAQLTIPEPLFWSLIGAAFIDFGSTVWLRLITKEPIASRGG